MKVMRFSSALVLALIYTVGHSDPVPTVHDPTDNVDNYRDMLRSVKPWTPVWDYRNAYTEIQAESCTFNFGGIVTMYGTTQSQMSYLDDGDTLGFSTVDFTSKSNGASSVQLRIQNADPSDYKSFVAIYHAKPSGVPVAVHYLDTWIKGYYTVTVPLSRPVVGVADIYVVFRSDLGTATRYYGIGDLDWIKFS